MGESAGEWSWNDFFNSAFSAAPAIINSVTGHTSPYMTTSGYSMMPVNNGMDMSQFVKYGFIAFGIYLLAKAFKIIR